MRDVSGYYFLTPVWGHEYTQLYVDVVIPAQLAEGNLPVFRGEGQFKYFIYTTSKDAEIIRPAASFRLLSEIIPAVIEIIDEEIKAPHDTMSNCFRRGIAAAEQIGAAGIFLTPDLVWADGSFATLKRLAESGRDAIFVPGVRTLKHGVAAVLREKYQKGSVIKISPRELMRVALDNLHPIADLSWFEEGETNLVPANLYWRVGSEGIVARCFHLHPILVYPQCKNPRFFGTVDDDYFCAACPDDSRDHVVTDSDELLAIELSDASRIFATGVPKRSVTDVALWAESSANERHRKLFNSTLRMHTGIRDVAAWNRAEEKAREAANAIQSRLNRPVWQLLLAHDRALPSRLVRLAQNRQLARVNAFARAPVGGSWFARRLNIYRHASEDSALNVIVLCQSARRALGAVYRSTARLVFGTPIRPQIWNSNYIYQRSLRRDLTALLKDRSRITVVCSHPKVSHVVATLDGGDRAISSAICIAQENKVRFVSSATKCPLRDESEEFLIIDRNLEAMGRLDSVIEEAFRVLTPGGRLLVLARRIVGFDPNENNLFFGMDFVARLLAPRFTVLEARMQGCLGTTLQTIMREWLRVQSLRWTRTRVLIKALFPLLMPIHIVLGLVLNSTIKLIDILDRSRSFHVTNLTLAIKDKRELT